MEGRRTKMKEGGRDREQRANKTGYAMYSKGKVHKRQGLWGKALEQGTHPAGHAQQACH
jgi:hypothetical protein